jgi:CRP-like cAMP-binding protein
MLWLTHHLKPKMLLPGETLNLASTEDDWLLLVTGGRLEILAAAQNGSQPAIAQLESGSFLINQDLNLNGWTGSSIKASLGEPVEVLIVEGPDFQRWLKETPPARAGLQQAAQERRAAWSSQPLQEAIR